MKKYPLPNQILPLLALLIFITSCNTQPKIDLDNDPKPIVQPKTNTPVDDPYFIETRDTFSTHGPRNITRNILQDQNGVFWLASWEGIITYDPSVSIEAGGKPFTNITLRDGLKHFHVFSLLEDKNRNLWFGTIGGGVYFKNHSKTGPESFTRFTKADGLAGNAIDCIFEDNKGNIWLGTDEGASRFDPERKTISSFTVKEGLSGNYIHSITQDKTGVLWFGTDGGVSRYKDKRFSDLNKKDSLPFSNVRSIIQSKSGIVWIGGSDGLFSYDKNVLTEISTDFIGYIFEDKTGIIWLSAGASYFQKMISKNNNGMVLNRYDPRKNEFTTIIQKVAHNDFQLFGIYEDQTGYIWFGTMNGVCRYDPSAGAITDENAFYCFTD